MTVCYLVPAPAPAPAPALRTQYRTWWSEGELRSIDLCVGAWVGGWSVFGLVGVCRLVCPGVAWWSSGGLLWWCVLVVCAVGVALCVRRSGCVLRYLVPFELS